MEECSDRIEYQLEFFTPTTENIKTLRGVLKKQGVSVCRDIISPRWIDRSLTQMSYGYAFVCQKAQIGRRSLKSASDKYLLKGFIVCSIMERLPHIVNIDLVCSRPDTRLGKDLLELAEEHAHTIPFVREIQLRSLPKQRLKAWYEKMGYVAVEDYDITTFELKSYIMIKTI